MVEKEEDVEKKSLGDDNRRAGSFQVRSSLQLPVRQAGINTVGRIDYKRLRRHDEGTKI